MQYSLCYTYNATNASRVGLPPGSPPGWPWPAAAHLAAWLVSLCFRISGKIRAALSSLLASRGATWSLLALGGGGASLGDHRHGPGCPEDGPARGRGHRDGAPDQGVEDGPGGAIRVWGRGRVGGRGGVPSLRSSVLRISGRVRVRRHSPGSWGAVPQTRGREAGG